MDNLLICMDYGTRSEGYPFSACRYPYYGSGLPARSIPTTLRLWSVIGNHGSTYLSTQKLLVFHNVFIESTAHITDLPKSYHMDLGNLRLSSATAISHSLKCLLQDLFLPSCRNSRWQDVAIRRKRPAVGSNQKKMFFVLDCFFAIHIRRPYNG